MREALHENEVKQMQIKEVASTPSSHLLDLSLLIDVAYNKLCKRTQSITVHGANAQYIVVQFSLLKMCTLQLIFVFYQDF